MLLASILRLPPTLLLAVFASAPCLASFENDFSSYPAGSVACLDDAAGNSGCDGDTVGEMNGCLCANGGGFVLATARCVGREAPDVLGSVYDMMDANCGDSSTRLTVTRQEFLRAGNSAQTVTSTGTTTRPTTTHSYTETTTPSQTVITSATGDETGAITGPLSSASDSPSNEDEGNPGGLSTPAQIGIAAGGVVAGLALAAAAVFFILRRRRSKQPREEAHPMLAQTAYPPADYGHTPELSSDFRTTPQKTGWAATAPSPGLAPSPGYPPPQSWGPTPPPATAAAPGSGWQQRTAQGQGYNWESPYEAPTYAHGSGASHGDQSGGYARLAGEQAQELAAPTRFQGQAPAEMPATPVWRPSDSAHGGAQ